jgi:hypothetical protein
MAATRELVSYFVPDSGAAPVVNATLALFPGKAAADAVHAEPARVWDNDEGFFVPAHAAAASGTPSTPPRKQRARNSRPKRARKSSPETSPQRPPVVVPTTATPVTAVRTLASKPDGNSPVAAGAAKVVTPDAPPAGKRFAGSTFEAASPDPTSLPIPKFSLLTTATSKTKALTDRDMELVPVFKSAANSFVFAPVGTSMTSSLTTELATTDLRRLLRI